MKENTPAFMSFGVVRIKLSNIKSYELYYSQRLVEREVEKSRFEKGLDKAAFGFSLAAALSLKSGIPRLPKPKKVISEERTYPVLLIATYQGEVYTFSQADSSFDVVSKADELDAYFL